MSMEKANQVTAATIIKNMEKRNFTGVYCATKEEALKKALSYMEKGAVVSWGGSMSAAEIGLIDAVKNSGQYEAVDRSAAKNYEEQRQIYAKAVLADTYIMSTNAITLEGELINIDGSGNRVGCLSYGPRQVILVVGMNKVVSTVEEGVHRTRSKASCPNTIRLGLKTPCSITGHCGECYGNSSICSHLLITRRCGQKDRIKVILVGEDLGY